MSGADRTGEGQDGATLHTWTRRGVGLTDVLTDAQTVLGEGAIALAWSPRRVLFARLEGAGLRGPDAPLAADDLDAVFELRLFTDRRELRWVRQPGGGRAALLSEDSEVANIGTEWTAADPLPTITTLDQHQLLWGTATDHPPAEGWSTLSEHRVGPLAVPLAGLSGRQRARLRLREYVTCDGEGNAQVAAERLVGLEPHAPEED